MKKKRLLAGLLASAVLLNGVPAYAAAPAGTPSEHHEKYLDGAPDGRFEPAKPLSRAQAAVIVYRLLDDAPPVSGFPFPDVPANAWYAQAAGSLAAAGLLELDEAGRFRPDDPLTRRECASLLAGFLPPADVFYFFPDVPIDDPACEAVSAAVAHGLFSSDETGAFRPDDPLTRAEAAVVFNRLLGRAPDPVSLANAARMRVFPDVPTNHWAYAQIIEAATTHEALRLETAEFEIWSSFVEERPRIADGFHLVDGRLYFARDGQYVTSETVGGFAFDEAGQYTTGDPALDETLAGIIRAQTNDGMSRDERLRALYDYVSRNFTYIKRDLVSKSQTGWQPSYAAAFFADGRGNCFSFAAAFQQLARAVGVDARTVVGNLGKNRQVHGWVEIDLDGETFVFDPELETVYRGRGQSYDLFKFRYAAAPFSYWK